MSQDIVADALNMIRNATKANKESVKVKRISNLLIEILKIMKQKNAIKKYKINSKDKSIEIITGELTDCKAIKPRFTVTVKEIEKYTKRYLPAKNIGILIISTSQGLMTHQTAEDKNIGGSLIAYMY